MVRYVKTSGTIVMEMTFLVLESLNTSIKNSPSFWFHCFHWHWKWPPFNEPCLHRWQSREKGGGGGARGAAAPCPKQTFWWGSAPPCFGVIIIIARIVHETILAKQVSWSFQKRIAG